MATFEGVRVSHTWDVILTEYVRQGHDIQINSGQRTMAEQQALYDQNMSGGRPRPGRPLTAVPNANAPHIKVGQENHALDVDQFAEDGEQEFQNWLNRNGVTAVNNVVGEGWHVDVPDERQLINFANEIRKKNRERNKYPLIKHKSGKNKPGHVRRLQRWLRAVGFTSVRVNGKYDARTQYAVMRYKRKHKSLKGGRKVWGKDAWISLERTMKGGRK